MGKKIEFNSSGNEGEIKYDAALDTLKTSSISPDKLVIKRMKGELDKETNETLLNGEIAVLERHNSSSMMDEVRLVLKIGDTTHPFITEYDVLSNIIRQSDQVKIDLRLEVQNALNETSHNILEATNIRFKDEYVKMVKKVDTSESKNKLLIDDNKKLIALLAISNLVTFLGMLYIIFGGI